MSAPGQDPMVPVSREDVQQELLRAVKAAAGNASTAQDTREMDEAGKAAKAFAEAWVMLEPTRLAGGDTPEARKSATPERPATSDGDRDGRIGE